LQFRVKQVTVTSGKIKLKGKTTMSITPQDFVSKWKRAEARERQAVQEHFIDLCALVGHETPMQQDPSGTRFAFEMGAAKTSGGSG
jgi:hypothetical protein